MSVSDIHFNTGIGFFRLQRENLARTWTIAKHLSADQLKETCLNLMSKNLGSFVSTVPLNILEFTSFRSLLQRQKVEPGSEEIKFLAIASWVVRKKADREAHVDDLLSTIAVNRINPKFLMDQNSCESFLTNLGTTR